MITYHVSIRWAHGETDEFFVDTGLRMALTHIDTFILTKDQTMMEAYKKNPSLPLATVIEVNIKIVQ